MSIKEIIETELNDKEQMLELRYHSSKIVFILMTLIYFVSLFLYWAWLFTNFFNTSLNTLYILMISSLAIFAFFFTMFKYKEKFAGNKVFILIALLVIVSWVLLLPVIIK